jgi:hypothetical protein
VIILSESSDKSAVSDSSLIQSFMNIGYERESGIIIPNVEGLMNSFASYFNTVGSTDKYEWLIEVVNVLREFERQDSSKFSMSEYLKYKKYGATMDAAISSLIDVYGKNANNMAIEHTTKVGGKYAQSIGLGIYNQNGDNQEDIYIQQDGSGNLTIDDTGTGDDNLVILSDTASAVFSRMNNDLFVRYSNQYGIEEYIKVLGQYNYNNDGVEYIYFGGVRYDRSGINNLVINDQTTDSDDIINGSRLNDFFEGGKGNDIYHGNGGNDSFIYKLGDGRDVIKSLVGFNPSGNSTLKLEGLNKADFRYYTDGLNLEMKYDISLYDIQYEGSIFIEANAEYFNEFYIKGIVYGNGESITISEAYSLARDSQITAGDDKITGTAGPDIMRGGKGNDHLAGGTGVDTYVYARGDGNDIVDDGGVFENNNLVLHGITVSEMKVAFVGYDVVISFADSATGAGDAGSIRFRADDYWHAHALGMIAFDDGTVLNPSQWTGIAYDQANVFNPGDGDRTVKVNFTDGAVHAFLLHGYTPDQVSVTGVDYLGQITLSMANATGGTPEAIHFVNPPWEKGVDQIQFDNGNVWTRDDLRYKAYLDDGTHGSTVTLDTAIYANQSAFVGGTGDTIYIVDAGLQPVSIADHGGTNALTLRGVSQAQVDFSVDAQTDELVLEIHDVPGRNDSVVKFANGLDTKGVAAVNFDDGSMTAAEIQTWIDTHHLAA